MTLDPGKDASNLAKHGVPLTLANELEWGDLLAWPDARRDYGEPRMVGLVPLAGRLYCVVFVDRPPGSPTQRRIISLRKANGREVKRYVENS